MELTIDAIGPQGDGIARQGGRPVYVPFTLPGEHVQAEGAPPRLNLVEIKQESAERTPPPCPHFGKCGGCQVQHWAQTPYQSWKRDLLTHAFSREAIDVTPEALVPCPAQARRRATLTARRQGPDVAIGFMARGTDELVAIGPCTILRPALEQALPDFAALAATIMRGKEDVTLSVLEADNGIAVALNMELDPSADMLTALVNRAAKCGFVQVAVNGAVIFERAQPIISFGQAQISPPPGGFLQAVAEIEDAMAKLVCNHLKKAKKAADLFSGAGTFTTRLAAQARVHAVEAEASALAALEKASLPSGSRPISTEVRDLFEAPLHCADLNAFDGVCLDPPRAGAATQVAELAASSVPKVAYISCDPKSLARDAAILMKGGYTLDSLTPFDQFLYTPHVEAVALFSKPKIKAKRSIFR